MKKDMILVVGADGLIGQALVTNWAHKDILKTTRQPDNLSKNRILLDLSQDISDWQPADQISVAFLCAAVTSLERCRTEPKQSSQVNIGNTVALAKKLVANGTFVIFLSTNLVYDGLIAWQASNMATCPHTEYGRQKAEAEKQLLALGNSVSIVRLTKVFGPKPGLLTGWMQSLQKDELIHPFSDMVLAPIPLSFTVNVLRRLAEVKQAGIMQLSAKEDVTYAQVALYIAERIGADPKLIQPISSAQANLNLEAVSKHTTLDTTELQQLLNLKPPSVWSTIDTVLSL